jgi:hypothetical protein
MSLKNVTLDMGNVTFALVDSVPVQFIVDGQAISNGAHLVAMDDANITLRKQITAKVRPAVLDAKTGSFSKDKKSVCFVVPTISAATGKTTFNNIRIEIEVDPLEDDDVRTTLREIGAQILLSSDCLNFWNYGSFE